MTPKELSQALQVRRLRERKAEAGYRRAKAVVEHARNALASAHNTLDAFDRDLNDRMNAFYERGAGGINPGAVEGMRAFHADQMAHRNGFVAAISTAEGMVAQAEQAMAEARAIWQRACNAAENLQTFSKEEARRLVREDERRVEMDLDELAVGIAGRHRQE